MKRSDAKFEAKAAEMGIDTSEPLRLEDVGKIAAQIPPTAHGEVWGEWKFNRDLLLLVHNLYGYEVDLEEITTSAQMLDWIFQIARKKWATPDAVYDLIEAFQELFDPQATLCSLGREHGPINAKLVVKGSTTR